MQKNEQENLAKGITFLQRERREGGKNCILYVRTYVFFSIRSEKYVKFLASGRKLRYNGKAKAEILNEKYFS